MTNTQGELWKTITQIYYQWNPDGSELMPINELRDKLPAVPSEMITETLSRARENKLAELDNVYTGGEFWPVRH